MKLRKLISTSFDPPPPSSTFRSLISDWKELFNFWGTFLHWTENIKIQFSRRSMNHSYNRRQFSRRHHSPAPIRAAAVRRLVLQSHICRRRQKRNSPPIEHRWKSPSTTIAPISPQPPFNRTKKVLLWCQKLHHLSCLNRRAMANFPQKTMKN